VEVELKYSHLQLAILGREVSELDLDNSLFFILIIEKIAFNCVSNSLVLNKRVYIITAFS
jgi:hypothetical protein